MPKVSFAQRLLVRPRDQFLACASFSGEATPVCRVIGAIRIPG
ncbi:hypothetical protein AB0M95_21175 [Sphaerisporangium sp. NPDC051017]